MDRPYVLISACLLGEACRYDGARGRLPGAGKSTLDTLRSLARLVPVCPEVTGGLSTPRLPSERRGERVVRSDGADVTGAYRRGAEEAVRLCRQHGIRLALLKARSPSCGLGRIYDGHFSGTLTDGDGVTVEALLAEGVEVYTEADVGALIKNCARQKKCLAICMRM